MTDAGHQAHPESPAPWRRRFRKGSLPLFVFRIAVGLTILAMQLPPIHGWDGHRYVVAVAIGVAATDWIVQALSGRDRIAAALGVYAVAVTFGFVLKEIVDAPRAALIPVTILTGLSAAACILLLGQRGHRTKELDRLIFSEATSIAFFTTLLFAVSWASAESWLDLPSLNAWGFAAVGMFSWVFGAIFLRRRYS